MRLSNLSAAFSALCLCWLSAATQVTDTVSDPAAAIREFHERVTAYAKLQAKLEATLPKKAVTNSPEAILARANSLAAKVRTARAQAKAGDIFTPAVSDEFRRLIKLASKGSESAIQSSLQSAEPVKLELKVNGPYPTSVPLQTTPPSLLANLPQLPAGLEYRVVGRALILRDREAHLIVDFIPNAI